MDISTAPCVKKSMFLKPPASAGATGTATLRDIHGRNDESTRVSGPFIAVNRGAITETLFKSGLFGHKRVAFSDASSDRQGQGLFESTNHGPLLMEEIGGISPGMQVKLLRVLQEVVLGFWPQPTETCPLKWLRASFDRTAITGLRSSAGILALYSSLVSGLGLMGFPFGLWLAKVLEQFYFRICRHFVNDSLDLSV